MNNTETLVSEACCHPQDGFINIVGLDNFDVSLSQKDRNTLFLRQKWIPVSEEPNKTDIYLVAYICKQFPRGPYIAKWDMLSKEFYDKDIRISIPLKPTHWMRLPKLFENMESLNL